MPPKATRASSAHHSELAVQSVDAFLEALEHPRKPEMLALRTIILGAAPQIGEGIKWNAPSFRTSEYFATFNLRAKDGVQLVLHLGAKKRADTSGLQAIADPDALLTWLGTDRATVTFRDLADVAAKRAAFVELLRQWVAQVQAP
jgi:hypothetical protein